MEEQEGPRGFKIDFNAEEQEPPEKEPAAAKKQPGEKPGSGRRSAGLVFAWLVLLIVLGGLFFLGYRHLNSRILELESMNENELQMISGEINERLTGISELMKEQTQQNRDLIDELENRAEENSGEIQDIKNALAVIRNSISELENTLKGTLEERIKDTESITDSQQERIDELASSVEKLQGLESDINEAGRAMQEAQSRADSLEKRVAEMQDNLIDAQSLEEKSEEISRSLDRKLESETGGMRERLNELEDQMQGLEAMINALEDMQRQNGRSSEGSGEIIEQELD